MLDLDGQSILSPEAQTRRRQWLVSVCETIKTTEKERAQCKRDSTRYEEDGGTGDCINERIME